MTIKYALTNFSVIFSRILKLRSYVFLIFDLSFTKRKRKETHFFKSVEGAPFLNLFPNGEGDISPSPYLLALAWLAPGQKSKSWIRPWTYTVGHKKTCHFYFYHTLVRQQNSGAVEDFMLAYSAVYLRIQKWKIIEIGPHLPKLS